MKYGSLRYSHKQGNLGRKFTVHTDGAPQLWLQFPVVSLRGKYKEQPEAYIHYAMNHYGPGLKSLKSGFARVLAQNAWMSCLLEFALAGGLKALLKREELSLSYSTMVETSAAGSFLIVMFALTEKGLQQSDVIMEYFFAYFNILRKQGVDEEILKKLQSLNQVMFDYQDRSGSESGYVTSLAGSLPSVKPRDVLTVGTLIDEVDLQLASKLLDCIRPGNVNAAVVTTETPSREVALRQEHEQYYDFNFSEEALDETLLQRLTSAGGFGLRQPPALAYVPTRLGLIRESTPRHSPEKLTKDGMELWWLGRGSFDLPKAQVQVKLAYPRSVTRSAARSVLAAMHSRLVQMVLEEPSDAFQMCGLSYNVAAGHDGLSVSFFGFNEHLVELVRLVMPQVKNPDISTKEFEIVRRQMVLDLSDVTGQQPYQHAMEAFDVVTVNGTHSRKDLLRAASDTWAVSLSEHQAMLYDMFANLNQTMLVSGNLNRAEAAGLASELQKILGESSKTQGVWGTLSSYLFGLFRWSSATSPLMTRDDYPLVLNPTHDVEIRVDNPIPGDPNSATIVAYQFGVPSLADRVRFSLISSIIERPVFEILRTEHQLGYVVFGFTTVHLDILEIRILVQGFRQPPDNVELLIESAVSNLTGTFAGMTRNEFEVRKATLRRELKKPPANLAEFAGRFWSQIWDQTYCFDKVEKELKFLDSADFQHPASLLQAHYGLNFLVAAVQPVCSGRCGGTPRRLLPHTEKSLR